MKAPKDKKASDRAALIRLASSLPKGSKERKAVLAGLQKQAISSSNFQWKGKPDASIYVRSGGRECPFCGSKDIEREEEYVRCGNCEARWTEVTKLTGIDVTKQPVPVDALFRLPTKGSPMGKSMGKKALKAASSNDQWVKLFDDLALKLKSPSSCLYLLSAKY